jgi:hypothetical protein
LVPTTASSTLVPTTAPSSRTSAPTLPSDFLLISSGETLSVSFPVFLVTFAAACY